MSNKVCAWQPCGCEITVATPWETKALPIIFCSLHAAAPRMLEALKGCLAYFDDMENAGVNAVHFMPDKAWLAPIRAILRDVEGSND